MPHGVLGHGLRLDELKQVVGASRLAASAGQPVAAERLAAYLGTRDASVDV